MIGPRTGPVKPRKYGSAVANMGSTSAPRPKSTPHRSGDRHLMYTNLHGGLECSCCRRAELAAADKENKNRAASTTGHGRRMAKVKKKKKHEYFYRSHQAVICIQSDAWRFDDIPTKPITEFSIQKNMCSNEVPTPHLSPS